MSAHRKWFEEHLFRVDEVVAVVIGEFEIFSQNNRASGASLLAISTKNAANHVDFVPSGVSFAGRVALFVGVFCGFNVNALGGACACAKRAADTFLKSVFVSRQNVSPSCARWQVALLLGIHDCCLFSSKSFSGEPEPGDDWSDDVAENFGRHV